MRREDDWTYTRPAATSSICTTQRFLLKKRCWNTISTVSVIRCQTNVLVASVRSAMAQLVKCRACTSATSALKADYATSLFNERARTIKGRFSPADLLHPARTTFHGCIKGQNSGQSALANLGRRVHLVSLRVSRYLAAEYLLKKWDGSNACR